MPNLSIRLRTTALGVYDGNTLALLERHDHARPDASRGVAREVVGHAARARHRLRHRRDGTASCLCQQ